MSDLTILTQSSVQTLVKLRPLPQSVLKNGLLFLWKLAWKSRMRLPYLLVIAFMILDVRLTLEVIVDVPENGIEVEVFTDSDGTETDSDDSVHLDESDH